MYLLYGDNKYSRKMSFYSLWLQVVHHITGYTLFNIKVFFLKNCTCTYLKQAL